MHNLILFISMPGGTEWLLILPILLPLYFLPAIIAGARSHPNTTSIFLLNLFLGWTFLGWIASLIWSCTAISKPPQTVIVNNPPQPISQERQTEKDDLSQQLQSDATQKASQDKIDQLRQFKQLLDEGIITNEEFNKQKAAILGQ